MNMERLCSYRFSSWEPVGNLSFNYSMRSWQLSPLPGPRGCSCRDPCGLHPTRLKNKRSQNTVQCLTETKRKTRVSLTPSFPVYISVIYCGSFIRGWGVWNPHSPGCRQGHNIARDLKHGYNLLLTKLQRVVKAKRKIGRKPPKL